MPESSIRNSPREPNSTLQHHQGESNCILKKTPTGKCVGSMSSDKHTETTTFKYLLWQLRQRVLRLKKSVLITSLSPSLSFSPYRDSLFFIFLSHLPPQLSPSTTQSNNNTFRIHCIEQCLRTLGQLPLQTCQETDTITEKWLERWTKTLALPHLLSKREGKWKHDASHFPLQRWQINSPSSSLPLQTLTKMVCVYFGLRMLLTSGTQNQECFDCRQNCLAGSTALWWGQGVRVETLCWNTTPKPQNMPNNNNSINHWPKGWGKFYLHVSIHQ